MKRASFWAAVLAAGMMSVGTLFAQTPSIEYNEFTITKQLPITSVKDQGNSGTCWSYSTTGFLEAELLRMGKPEVDLSDMFIVSKSYKDKGQRYVRMHGKLNFGQGGSSYDVIYVLKHYGAMPEGIMKGVEYGSVINAHSEMADVAESYLKGIVKNPNGKLSPAWSKGYNALIDAYLGEIPETFTYNGKTYTPVEFGKSLGLNADDYVSITSYTHHPFYTQFPLEIEDNWRWSSSYNVPIDDLMAVVDNALANGYTIAWGADVSEVGFTRDGIAVLADVQAIETKGSDQARWIGLSYADKQAAIMRTVYSADCPEIEPTQEFRQMGFDNYTLTDDHGMVIYGTAKNQNGRPFYLVKNSWGDAGKYDGIWYASRNYVAGRTMNIVVHKKAIPAAIAKKMGIK